MNFRGLSEPLVGRVCSAGALERHVGTGFLGSIRNDDPLVELLGVALSDDEKSLMVHVHAATAARKFVGIATVTVAWYEAQFETNVLLRDSPDDACMIDSTPCRFFEGGANAPLRRRPSVAELFAADSYEFSRSLATSWLLGRRPVRRTEQFFLAIIAQSDENLATLAQTGLSLLAEALSSSSITPALKRRIGELCVEIAHLHYTQEGTDSVSDDTD